MNVPCVLLRTLFAVWAWLASTWTGMRCKVRAARSPGRLAGVVLGHLQIFNTRKSEPVVVCGAISHTRKLCDTTIYFFAFRLHFKKSYFRIFASRQCVRVQRLYRRKRVRVVCDCACERERANVWMRQWFACVARWVNSTTWVRSAKWRIRCERFICVTGVDGIAVDNDKNPLRN